MDRFLLCENPMKNEFRPTYILQTIPQRMLIQVIAYDDASDLSYSLDDVFDLFTYINPEGLTERYMLMVVALYDLQDSEIDANIETIRLHVSKAWKWYKSYLIMADKQMDEEGNSDNFYFN